MPNILVTGFEPFGGERINPSLEAITVLDGEQIEGHTVIGKSLPVTFAESIDVLYAYIKEVKPDFVISVGQAGGRSAISVERVAINVIDATIPDNNGDQLIDEPIRSEGPVAYWSTLPIKSIVENVRRAGIPAEVSQTAGTYVCNHLFYGLMDLLSKNPTIRGGFIHIPFIPEQAVRFPGQPSLHLDNVIKALRIAILTTITTQTDLKEIGGKTH